MVHRRHHRHPGRHLVIEQPPHLLAQHRLNAPVVRLVRALGVGVNTAGQVALKVPGHLHRLIHIVGYNRQALVAEGLLLQGLSIGQKGRAIDLEQGILEAEAIAAAARTAGQHLSAGAGQHADAVRHRVFDRLGKHSAHWRTVELGAGRLQKGVGAVVLEQQ